MSFKEGDQNLMKKRLNQFAEHFIIKDNNFICKFCNIIIEYKAKQHILKHISTKKHSTNMNKAKNNGTILTSTALHTTPKRYSTPISEQVNFNEDLLKMCLEANIPVNKINHPSVRSFLSKYIDTKKYSIPEATTLNKTYLPRRYNVIEEIRNEINDNSIWISVDETTDICGRYMVHFIVGILNENQPGKGRILTSEPVSSTNGQSISDFVDKALCILWPDGIKYDKVLLLVSDGAPYMILAGKLLKTKYTKLIHLTCLAHATHRISEVIRDHFEKINNLISSVKKVFIKAPFRRKQFKIDNPDLCLPPEPVITRWGTWLDAVNYYHKNYEAIINTIKKFNPKEAKSIQKAQELFQDNALKEDLNYVYSNFSIISTTITKLQESNVPITTSLNLIDQLKADIENLKSKSI